MNSNTSMTTNEPRKYNNEDKEPAYRPHFQHSNLEPAKSSSSPSSSSSSSSTSTSTSSGSKTRVVEIPVHHYQSNSNSPGPSGSASTFSSQQPPRGEDFASKATQFPTLNPSSLFDNYQSPFDLLNRRAPVVNRDRAAAESSANTNAPFSANFGAADAEDFFSKYAERLFGRNSPSKEPRQASNSPARYADPAAPASTNLTGSNRQSPLNVNTDSPKRYTTQTTIQPNHSPNTNSPAAKIGVEIPITHVSSSSSSSSPNTATKNEKPSYSDFQHPKTVPDSKQPPAARNNPSTTTPTQGPDLGGASKMGNSSSSTTSQTNKKQSASYETSDFATPLNRPAAQPAASSQPKSEEEKCSEIESELNALEHDVLTFAGTKTSDRSYLKLEEMLTRCLLKLDAIERGEERINQTRRRLINYTHQLSDKLETRAIENENNQKGGGGAESWSSSSSSDTNQPPASKRPKSPPNGDQHLDS